MTEQHEELVSKSISPLYRGCLILRSAVYWIWQILFTCLIGPFVVVIGLFSDLLAYRVAMIWIHGNIWALRLICGVSWQVDGQENIPDQPCIVMSKHQSTWDAYFLPMTFFPAVYVAKRSLKYIPIFGWALWVLRFIPFRDFANGGSG